MRTPSASSARFRADRHIHEISAMPTKWGQKPHRRSRQSNPAVTRAVNSTVETATTTARRLSTADGGSSRFAIFSAKAMYFPISRTGW